MNINKKNIVACFFILYFVKLSIIVFAQDNGKFEFKDNMRIDKKTKIPVALYNVRSKVYQGSPEEIARTFLKERKGLLGMSDNLQDMEHTETRQSTAGWHVIFKQKYKGFPVYQSETVVSINHENRVSMVMNGYRPSINIPSVSVVVSSNEAISTTKLRLRIDDSSLISKQRSELYIYEDTTDNYHLAWKINFVSKYPIGDWQAFVDANSGEIISFRDISMNYIQGKGRVFNPDPVSKFGQHNYVHDCDDQICPSWLPDLYTYDVPLNDLNNPIGGLYKLQGRYARSEDIESKHNGPVTSSDPNQFSFYKNEVALKK